MNCHMQTMVRAHGAISIREENIKLLWDFNVQTDKVIQARRPDIILTKKEKKCLITYILIPVD